MKSNVYLFLLQRCQDRHLFIVIWRWLSSAFYYMFSFVKSQPFEMEGLAFFYYKEVRNVFTEKSRVGAVPNKVPHTYPDRTCGIAMERKVMQLGTARFLFVDESTVQHEGNITL